MSYSRVVLLKDNGQSQGFNTIADAMAAADANDLINVYPGAHAVAAALAAKSNVMINLLPGSTVTFAAEITIGAAITNFKIVGDGNLVFTSHAFKPTAVVGAGNRIDIRGDVTVGACAVFGNSDVPTVQTQYIKIIATNITIVGGDGPDDRKPIVINDVGQDTMLVHLKAFDTLTISSIAYHPYTPDSYLKVEADTIVCIAADANTGANLYIIARKLILGTATTFADPDSASSNVTFEVESIDLNLAAGLVWNALYGELIFVRHVKIKNSSNNIAAHVIAEISGETFTLKFLSGAVLYTAGGANAKAIEATAITVLSNGNIYSNKPLSVGATMDIGTFVEDAALVL